MAREEKICERCVMDTAVPDIAFDGKGECNYCKAYDKTDRMYPNDERGQKKLDEIVERIKQQNIDKPYDCVVGISGGTDSTYLLYWAKKVGLRSLAVHFDNGWNSEISVRNIKKAIDKLDIDLYTYVVDWEEFKDLQIAFLKASTPDADKPADIGLRSILYKVAAEEKLNNILVGVNFRNEGKVPIFWSYGDGRYINSVHKRYGTKKLDSYPNFTILDYLNYGFAKGIQQIRPLWYLDYQKTEVRPLLEKELDWEYYGGHHFENIYTRFLHGYYLPEKFGIDKRKVEYSALIRSGQMSRAEALSKLEEPPYPLEKIKADIEYVIKKLNLTEQEFTNMLNAPPKTFLDYETYYPMLNRYRTLAKFAFSLIYSSPPQIFNYLGDDKK